MECFRECGRKRERERGTRGTMVIERLIKQKLEIECQGAMWGSWERKV